MLGLALMIPYRSVMLGCVHFEIGSLIKSQLLHWDFCYIKAKKTADARFKTQSGGKTQRAAEGCSCGGKDQMKLWGVTLLQINGVLGRKLEKGCW